MWGQVKEETNEIHFHQIRVGEIFGRQLKNPLLIVLGIATFVAYVLGQSTNATVISPLFETLSNIICHFMLCLLAY